MTNERQRRGYLRDPEQLQTCLDYLWCYDAAARSKTLIDQMRFYQRAFHSKTRATQRTNEIFQSRVRNCVKSVDQSLIEELVLPNDTEEYNRSTLEDMSAGPDSFRHTVEDSYISLEYRRPDLVVDLPIMLDNLFKSLEERESLLLAFWIVKAGLSDIIENEQVSLVIQSCPKLRWVEMYQLIGSRRIVERIRSELTDKLVEIFSDVELIRG